ncbi:MAG: 50S ribosomal protein L31 [Anaerolineae bacterium]|jgi:large subunit ribosomal protein L31
MKPDIHPEWHPNARVTCSCGATFTVGATVPEIQTEVCDSCHPFFTGEQRIVDTAGQVERFMRRLEAGATHRDQERERREKKAKAELAAKRKRRGLEPIRAQRDTADEDATEGAAGAEQDESDSDVE